MELAEERQRIYDQRRWDYSRTESIYLDSIFPNLDFFFFFPLLRKNTFNTYRRSTSSPQVATNQPQVGGGIQSLHFLIAMNNSGLMLKQEVGALPHSFPKVFSGTTVVTLHARSCRLYGEKIPVRTGKCWFGGKQV